MNADPLTPWTPGVDGPWDRDAARHLLVRAGIGPSRSEIAAAVDRGLAATLEALIHPTPSAHATDMPVEHVLARGSIDALAGWWMARLLSAQDPLGDRLWLLWHGHFATSNDKVNDPRAMHAQSELLRQGARGDFRQLVHSIARDPAMLIWLDGVHNRVGEPNENFARELLELFALGIGNYDENDIRELARCFTGWSVKGRQFEFVAEQHDQGTKAFLGRRGSFDGAKAVAIVLEQPACARHVAGRLLREFVALPVDEAACESLARVLVQAQWRIDETLRVLLSSRLFFSPQARKSRIAAPVELIVRSVRILEAKMAPDRAARAAASMGQALFRPPTVKGWDGGRAWIDTASWIARHNFLAELASADGSSKDSLRCDLAPIAGGEDAAREAVAKNLVAALLGDSEAQSSAEGALQPCTAAAHDATSNARARKDVATLALTSPEFQLT